MKALRSLLLTTVLVVVAGCGAPEREAPARSAYEVTPDTTLRDAPGFLYGRVVTHGGAAYTGRLRWGGAEEAFWGDYFNGAKSENPWAEHAALPERRPVLFGIELPGGDRPETSRPFMARFGDLARIESVGEGMRDLVEQGTEYDPAVRVTLKSGTSFDLDRLESSDFDDGVRVWDLERGVVDLGPRQIRSIDLLPTAALRAAPARLYGAVETTGGTFTGFVQWDRTFAVATDPLVGRAEDREVRVPFGSVQRLERRPDGRLVVTRRDGGAVTLGDVGRRNRGLYVDDARYGRVLVSWNALRHVTFSEEDPGSGPAYAEYSPGRALTGCLTLRSGERIAGRLVYDLDESETTETLDAPAGSIDYTIPFGRVASVSLPDDEKGAAAVQLHGGETLLLERAGDLGPTNGGMLVFPPGQDRPQYVAWGEVAADRIRPARGYRHGRVKHAAWSEQAGRAGFLLKMVDEAAVGAGKGRVV